jgi:hypothetical protein
MGIALLLEMMASLPGPLRDQVVGYADSVRLAAPSIARDCGIEHTKKFEDHIVFISGIRKLFSIVSSSYWSLDNSATLLSRSDISAITIAGRSFSRGSELHQELHSLLTDLEAALAESGVLSMIQLSFSEMAEAVSNELG